MTAPAGAAGHGAPARPQAWPRLPGRVAHFVADAGYAALGALLLPWAFGRTVANPKARARWTAYLRDVPARFGRRAPRRSTGPCVWVHGVSVGEVKAAARLVERIEQRVPGIEVVVTATTDTGYRVARERYPGHRVEFYPPDVSWIVRDALDRLRPDLVVLVESEFWPNFLTAVSHRGIPTVLVNGRISERSASRFRRGGRLTRGLLSAIARFCVQLPVHADRFTSLGLPADHVVVTGNLKFDNVPILADRRRSDAYANLLGVTDGRPLFVAGSTHPPEERWMGQVVRRVRAGGVPLRAVVAPRHPARADAVEADLRREGVDVVRRSRLVEGGAKASGDAVVLLDTVGELEAVYALADVVYVGGSLVRHGGQNVMEPASVGKPILVGPHTWNFRGEVDLLAASGALEVVSDVDALVAGVLRALGDPAAARARGERGREAILESKGATERTLAALEPWLAPLAARAPGAGVSS
ncbi:MAG: 3-deoxy-D-manno-octulosonic acid transferase [Planctomycetia bacterium]|nr:3-deoxy-D-manno-octulosonic acid transferase [Planctomycetia bacterium]